MKLGLLINIGKFLIPLSVIILNIIFPGTRFGWIFAVYVALIAVERSFETFYTGKFKSNKENMERDWCFKAVASSYIIMAFIMILEFFYAPREIKLPLVLSGGIIFITALILRIQSINALGGTWQLNSSSRPLIINKGPYKYMRHPIYLGVILESIAIPLVPGTYYALLFSLFVCIPLIVFKTYSEEKMLLTAYGEGYKDYMLRRWAFLPFKKGFYKQ